MSKASLKALLEAERHRLWRRAVKDHPQMTPASAELVEKEIEKKLKAFAKNACFPNPIKRPRQISFDFLRDYPVGRRFRISKPPR